MPNKNLEIFNEEEGEEFSPENVIGEFTDQEKDELDHFRFLLLNDQELKPDDKKRYLELQRKEENAKNKSLTDEEKEELRKLNQDQFDGDWNGEKEERQRRLRERLDNTKKTTGFRRDIDPRFWKRS